MNYRLLLDGADTGLVVNRDKTGKGMYRISYNGETSDRLPLKAAFTQGLATVHNFNAQAIRWQPIRSKRQQKQILTRIEPWEHELTPFPYTTIVKQPKH